MFKISNNWINPSYYYSELIGYGRNVWRVAVDAVEMMQMKAFSHLFSSLIRRIVNIFLSIFSLKVNGILLKTSFFRENSKFYAKKIDFIWKLSDPHEIIRFLYKNQGNQEESNNVHKKNLTSAIKSMIYNEMTEFSLHIHYIHSKFTRAILRLCFEPKNHAFTAHFLHTIHTQIWSKKIF